MAMTLRMTPDDETLLREIAAHDSRNLTDEITALVRTRYREIAESQHRASVRSAMRTALEHIETRDAVALDLLSR